MKHALLIVPLLFGACVGGDIGAPNLSGKPDAAGTTPVDAFVPPIDMDLSAGCVDRVVAAINPGPRHNNGDVNLSDPVGCLAVGCHNYAQHGNNPPFLFGGTVYKPGTTDPDPGVTIIITPDNTAIPPIKVTTSAKGTFYVPQLQGSTPEMPASAIATACPQITKGHQSGKIKRLTAPGDGGNCNACHTATGEGGVQPHLNVGI